MKVNRGIRGALLLVAILLMEGACQRSATRPEGGAGQPACPIYWAAERDEGPGLYARTLFPAEYRVLRHEKGRDVITAPAEDNLTIVVIIVNATGKGMFVPDPETEIMRPTKASWTWRRSLCENETVVWFEEMGHAGGWTLGGPRRYVLLSSRGRSSFSTFWRLEDPDHLYEEDLFDQCLYRFTFPVDRPPDARYGDIEFTFPFTYYARGAAESGTFMITRSVRLAIEQKPPISGAVSEPGRKERKE